MMKMQSIHRSIPAQSQILLEGMIKRRKVLTSLPAVLVVRMLRRNAFERLWIAMNGLEATRHGDLFGVSKKSKKIKTVAPLSLERTSTA